MLLCTAARDSVRSRTTSSGIGQKPIGWLVLLQMRMHQPNWNIARCVWWHHGKILHWCHADTHERCAVRVAEVDARYPVCRTEITMVMRLFK